MRLKIVSSLFAGLVMVISAKGIAATNLEGTVRIDGSSTVYPISEAMAEEFGKLNSKVRVTVGESGTGGGFKKFIIGETDINDASRPIKDSEKAAAVAGGIDYVALPVAHDGITIVVNKDNTWVDKLTVAELKKLWEPGSKIQTWKDLRPQWPNRKISLYGPGTDSGTFDYFTEEINGKAQSSRADFTKSEDDNVLVQGVAGDKDSLGYFGYAYYMNNKAKLKVVPVDNGHGAVTPSDETITNEKYSPLSRIVYIYVAKKSAARKEVAEFVRFYLEKAPALVKEVGYVPLSPEKYKVAKAEFAKALKK